MKKIETVSNVGIDCDEEAIGWSERKKISKRVLKEDDDPANGMLRGNA